MYYTEGQNNLIYIYKVSSCKEKFKVYADTTPLPPLGWCHYTDSIATSNSEQLLSILYFTIIINIKNWTI